jgi:curli biogenesis system outer membrane secretion channel CsgG
MTTAQAAMGEILAARIVDRFSQSPQYEVVERENLLKILEEQHLGSSELADDQTRLRLGRIIGCRQMVFGAYQVIGHTMRLDIRTVDVSSGKVLRTATGTVSAEAVGNWLAAADQAAEELIGR